MNDHITKGLDQLRRKEYAEVVSLPENQELRRRLMSLGLTKGTVVTQEFSGIIGKPKAYFFRGSLIALRDKDAHNILIKSFGKQ